MENPLQEAKDDVRSHSIGFCEVQEEARGVSGPPHVSIEAGLDGKEIQSLPDRIQLGYHTEYSFPATSRSQSRLKDDTATVGQY